MSSCQVEGCTRTVSKAGYSFCLDHWKAERNGGVTRCERCQRWHDTGNPLCRSCDRPPTQADGNGNATANARDEAEEAEAAGGYLSSTRLGKQFGLSSVKVNLILAELGWIERYVKGWVPTDRGNALGANVREMRNGTPFVVWPA